MLLQNPQVYQRRSLISPTVGIRLSGKTEYYYSQKFEKYQDCNGLVLSKYVRAGPRRRPSPLPFSL